MHLLHFEEPNSIYRKNSVQNCPTAISKMFLLGKDDRQEGESKDKETDVIVCLKSGTEIVN